MLHRIKKAAKAVVNTVKKVVKKVGSWFKRNTAKITYFATGLGLSFLVFFAGFACISTGIPAVVLLGLVLIYIGAFMMANVFFQFENVFATASNYSSSYGSSDSGYTRSRFYETPYSNDDPWDFDAAFRRGSYDYFRGQGFTQREETESDPRKVRINKLRAKAQSTQYADEAKLFNDKADELERKYGFK